MRQSKSPWSQNGSTMIVEEFSLARDGTERPPGSPRYWSARSKRVVMVMVFIIIALAIVIAVRETTRPRETRDMCVTKECIILAEYQLDHITPDADPCQNFDNFTCGKFKKQYVMSADVIHVNTINVMQNQQNKRMRDLILNAGNVSETDVLGFLKKFYNGCIADTYHDRIHVWSNRYNKNVKEFYHLIVNYIGGVYGTRELSLNSYTDIAHYLGRLRRLGINLIFTTKVQLAPETLNKYILEIQQPTLLFRRLKAYEPQFNRFRQQIMKTYLRDFYNFFPELGLKSDDFDKLIPDVMDFEFKLKDFSDDYDMFMKKRMLVTQQQDLNGFQDKYKIFPWGDYFSEFLSDTLDEEFPEMKVNVPNEDVSPSKVLKLLEMVNKTGNLGRILSTYAAIAIMDQFKLGFSNSSKQDTVSPLVELSPDWMTCINIATRFMPRVTSYVYAKYLFDSTKIPIVEEILKTIKTTLVEEIKKTYHWIDDKEVYIDKVNEMKVKIGFDENEMDENRILAGYNYINLDDKFSNILFSLVNNSVDRYFSKLGRVRGKQDSWPASVSRVGAYYQLYNVLFINAAMLNGPIFEKTYPPALQFGGIGSVLTHEMMHGFNSFGLRRDKHGNLYSLSEPIFTNLTAQQTCIAQLYQSFAYLSGPQTAAEDLIDISTVDIIFKAFQKYQKETRDQTHGIPGMGHFSDAKIFFIQMASGRCETVREDYAQFNAVMKHQSTASIRINGPLLNSEYFAKSFECPKDSLMNSAKRCKKLW